MSIVKGTSNSDIPQRPPAVRPPEEVEGDGSPLSIVIVVFISSTIVIITIIGNFFIFILTIYKNFTFIENYH